MNYPARQLALRHAMETAGVDALLVSFLPNIRYLCGFSGSNGLLLLTGSQTVLFTDGRYREQAAQEVEAARVSIPPRGDLWRAAAERAGRSQRLGVDEVHLSWAERQRLLSRWPQPARQLRTASGWVEALRTAKEPAEIAAVRRAVNLASSVFLPVVKQLRSGMAETEAAGRLEFALRQAGGEGLSFDTIIAAGARGARVHGHPSAAPLPRRGFMVMDYGVILGGYVSDMTRTVHLGRPDRRAQQVYAVVLEAQAAATEAVRPGVDAAVVDAAARKVIRRAGMSRYFPHSTGHGVGLEIHEAPRLAATSKDVLSAGQIITIEPGIYIPGWGGVRIEDVVLVTANGREVLTPTTKELLTI